MGLYSKVGLYSRLYGINLFVYFPFLQAAATCGYISLLSTVGERLAARMREALFSSLIRQDIAFFDDHGTGELINR